MMDLALLNYLKEKNIEYKEFKHPPMFKVSDEKKAKKNIPGEKSKNLFLKDENNNFYLAVWQAYQRLPMSFLKKKLKIRSLEFASSEELKIYLKTTPGSVSIFSLIYAKNISVIIDRHLWEAEYSGYHPNENTSTFVISKEDLHKFISSLKIKYKVISLNE